EKSIFPNHPLIKKTKERMYNNGAIFASMTGSGSAVFGIFEKK
ncbi:MAG: 4-(cytidine 5'-diphospho)-2-C-methyl-D-erythritol kinase, partial [Flavobacteriales bacterium]|nr:4-(cytidine 5'-diphospho)-2-C-methyl-D-erythritol kinase [Flavobacteriales bacterium]